MASKSPRQGVSRMISYFQSQVDRIVKPQQREKFYNAVLSFAQEQPLYFTFLTLQLLLSAFPVVLFTVFTTSTVILSLSAAILFSLFWIGIALCLLVPTLFITVITAAIAFSWIAASFLAGKWMYDFVSAKGMSKQINGHEAIKVDEKKRERFANTGNAAMMVRSDDEKDFTYGNGHSLDGVNVS